jgi:hypothetical protein
MTNAQIILNESISLMEQGILKGSGQFGQIETETGTITIELPEAIHTFNGWKALGYSVKKGEKSSIKFPIWKHTTKMLNTDTGNAELDKMNTQINEQGGQTNMFMKMSAWFTAAQVEPIKAKA